MNLLVFMIIRILNSSFDESIRIYKQSNSFIFPFEINWYWYNGFQFDATMLTLDESESMLEWDRKILRSRITAVDNDDMREGTTPWVLVRLNTVAAPGATIPGARMSNTTATCVIAKNYILFVLRIR